MIRIHALALVIAFAASSATAQAQLVTNGGFETGNLTGWTRQTSGLCLDQVSSLNAHTGTYGLVTAPFSGFCLYTQDIATTAGAQYNFTFWIANLGGGKTQSSFEAFWDGGTVYSLTSVTEFDYVQQSFFVTATAPVTSIGFFLKGDDSPNFYRLDDISVLPASTTVPEPSSLALLAIGVLGALATHRRRHDR